MPFNFDELINAGSIDLTRPPDLALPADPFGAALAMLSRIDPMTLVLLAAIAVSTVMRRLARFRALKPHHQEILKITADAICLAILAARLLLRSSWASGVAAMTPADRVLLLIGTFLFLRTAMTARSRIVPLIDRIEAERDDEPAAARGADESAAPPGAGEGCSDADDERDAGPDAGFASPDIGPDADPASPGADRS